MTEQDDQQARQGYLLLADISGYTAFLTGTELEHAHAIVRELTKLIRERLAPPMRFVKLEGDAVFCYAEAEGVCRRRAVRRADRGLLLRFLQPAAGHDARDDLPLRRLQGDPFARPQVRHAFRHVHGGA